jgi:hypothetical protein
MVVTVNYPKRKQKILTTILSIADRSDVLLGCNFKLERLSFENFSFSSNFSELVQWGETDRVGSGSNLKTKTKFGSMIQLKIYKSLSQINE